MFFPFLFILNWAELTLGTIFIYFKICLLHKTERDNITYLLSSTIGLSQSACPVIGVLEIPLIYCRVFRVCLSVTME